MTPGEAMKTQAALIAADPVYLTWLKEVLGQAVDLHWLRPDDPVEPVSRQLDRVEGLEVAFVEAEPADQRTPLLEQLAEKHAGLLLIAIGADSPTEAVIDTMRAGARDFFVMGRDDAQLGERLRKLLRKSNQAQVSSEPGGHLYSVHGALPTPTLAWTAEHLALAVLERAAPRERVLLLDVASPHGASLVFMNLAQTYTLLDAVQDVYRCDQTLIDTAFVRHASGLYVLSLPEDRVEPLAFEQADLLTLLDVLARHFDSIILCGSSNLHIETHAGIVARARRSLMLGDGSILSSRANKHLLKALRLEEGKLDRLGLVLDSDGLVRGLDAANLAQLVELPLWAEMPVNHPNRIRAMNSGESLFKLSPKDSYCRAVEDLVERLLDPDARMLTAAPDKPGLLQRVFGA